MSHLSVSCIVRSLAPRQAAVPQAPSQEMVLIIDKMASYVAKNGRAFEDIVRSKCDKRFAFLDETHHLHALYKTKIAHHLSLLQPPKKKRRKSVAESKEPAVLMESTVEPQPQPQPLSQPETETQDTDTTSVPESNGIEEDQPPPPGEGDTIIGPQQEHSPEPELQDEPCPESAVENGQDHSADEEQQHEQTPSADEEEQELEKESVEEKQEEEDKEDEAEEENERDKEFEDETENSTSQKQSEKSSREGSPATDSEKEEQSKVSKPAPVCFSIKKPREIEGLEMRSALPIEESTDEEESEESKKSETNKKPDPVKKPEPVKRAEPTKRVESSRRQELSRRPTESSERKRPHEFSDRERERERERDRERERERERERKRAAASERHRMEAERKRLTPDARRGETEHKKSIPDRRKPHIEAAERQTDQHSERKRKKKKKEEQGAKRGTAEVIDLTGDVTDEKRPAAEKDKWAEERLKDRLAAAAREKIAAAAREKQLQLERKRRAAAFLNMIRKDHPLPMTPVIGPTLPDGGPVQRVSADEDEISSLPSPASSDIPSPPTTPLLNRDRDSCGTSTGNSTPAPVQQSSLLARLQAAQQELKRPVHSHSPSSEVSKPLIESQAHVRHKHKRKKDSSHHSSHHKKASSPHKHRHKRDDSEKPRKLKKKERDRAVLESSSRHKEKRKKHHKSMKRHLSASSVSS